MIVTVNNKNEMRSQLVLIIFSLWGAPRTQQDQCDNELLSSYIERINCGDKKNIKLYCDDNCLISYGDGCYTSDEVNIECVCDECNSEPREANSSINSTTVVVLGVLVGLLLVLLTMVTTTLVWTCWLLRIRGRLNSSAEHQARSSTDHGQLVNPTYEGDDLLRVQLSGSVPAYETIPLHPRGGARLEFIEQGENGYHVLSREQRANPDTTSTTHMETILEDSREESYSKLELKEGSSSTKKTSDEEYSRLEGVNVGSSVPKDAHLDNDATVNFNYDSSEQTERKERVIDDKAFDDNGDALQLESGDVEKGQQEEAKGKPPLITITPDVQNVRNDSNNTSSSDNA